MSLHQLLIEFTLYNLTLRDDLRNSYYNHFDKK
jgi:hypothetical protein